MFWLLLIIITCVFAMLYNRLKRYKFKKIIGRYKSCARELPFIGHVFLFLFADQEEQTKLIIQLGKESYQYGGMLIFWLCNKLYIGVSNAEVADVILKSSIRKDDLMNLIHSLTGNGSLFAPELIWRHRRKMIAPTFRMTNLIQYVKIFDEQSKVMMKCLKEVRAEPFSISEYFTRYSLDAVCESTLGVQMQSQLNPAHPFAIALQRMFELLMVRMLRPWLYNDTIYRLLPDYKEFVHYRDIVTSFITEVIDTTKQSEKYQLNDQIGLKSFLTHIMLSAKNNGDGLNNKEISEEALVLLIAGTDTSAVAMSFAAVMLSRHPDVQDRCHQELLEVFGETDRPVTPADLIRLKYLEAVIKETIRLYPPAPIVTRKAENDIKIPSTGDVIPKGCGIFVAIYSLHRNPQYWGADADLFRPERFLDKELKHPAAFMPFSWGPRNCLGYQYAMMSMKTVLANLLRRYNLVGVYPRGKPEPIRLKNDLMLRDLDNFPLRIQPRKQNTV